MNTAPQPPSPTPPQRPIRFGLRFKVLLALTAFNAVAIALFTANRYETEKDRILEGLQLKLSAAAYALPDMLPAGYLDRAVQAGAVPPEEYRRILDQLTQYCRNTGLRYLYTYTRQGGTFYCTSSNATPEELATNKYTLYWAPYDSAPPTLFRAWDEKQPVYEEVTDQWGRFYTLFLPLRTPSGAEYIAGADIAISFVDAALASSLRESLLIGIASFAGFFAISFWLSTGFSRHIGHLAAYTHDLAAANFASNPDSPLRRRIAALPARRHDEVGQLADAFIRMEDRLGTYLIELKETTAANERFQNELKIAGDIQASMLPHEFPASDRVDLHAAMKPAKEAGGDLYDCFPLDADHLCFVIGDVSDKGMPAALFMAVTLTVIRAKATADLLESPEEILRRTNELLVNQNQMYQFVTMFLGVLNTRTGAIVYTDGGHNRPYHRTKAGARMLPPGGGVALGVMAGAVYKRHTLQLQPGETLCLYTDGVTEAIAADDSFYGEPRLERLLSSVSFELKAGEWVETVTKDVSVFSQGHAQADDITVLAIRYTG